MRVTSKYLVPACAVVLLFSQGHAVAAAATEAPSERWDKIRSGLFKDRKINAGGDQLVELAAPARAEDAAVVPISIKTKIPQNDKRYIKTMYLIVDKNPAPVAATFHITPAAGRADVETRVRIEEYTNVRVVVEMNDEQLFMTSQFVKASGGCSAPAGKDAAAAARNLGKMRLSLPDSPQLDSPVLAQLMIRHPNSSGLAMDQVTRMYAPPHYVKRLEVSYAGTTIMTADTDISISENPNFRFYFVPKKEGELSVVATDSNDLVFKTALQVQGK
jgi:sulfur-oxidizing protein SoxY